MDILEKEIKEFNEKGGGWLSPKGQLISCEIYEHCDTVSEFLDGVGDLLSEIDRVDYEYDHWNEDTPDEHPAWHIFEIYHEPARDEARRGITLKAYEQGWLRLGMWVDGIEAEGYEFNHSNMKKLKDLAEMIGKELTVRNLKEEK